MQLRGYYRPGDCEAMHRLDLKCFSPAFRFDLETMREAAEAESAIVVVVEQDHHDMVGFVIVHLEESSSGRYAYIVTLDVAPQARRSGVATVMLQHAEEQARAAGAKRMALHVAEDNAAAIAFYERLKYIRAGVARNFYREAGLDAFVYAKQLQKQAAQG